MSRRDLLTVLTVGTAAAFIVAFGHIVTADGLSPMDVGLLVLHAVLTLWLVHGLWLAVVGFCVLAGRKLRDGFAARAAGAATWRNPVRRAETRRSAAHTYELQSLMSISYAVCCLKKKKKIYSQIEYKQQHK